MKTFLAIMLVIVSIVMIVSILAQPSKMQGLTNALAAPTDTFFSKNKARTREVMLKRVTAVSAFLFAALIVALNLIK